MWCLDYKKEGEFYPPLIENSDEKRHYEVSAKEQCQRSLGQTFVPYHKDMNLVYNVINYELSIGISYKLFDFQQKPCFMLCRSNDLMIVEIHPVLENTKCFGDSYVCRQGECRKKN